jgi:putative salt-induced outer membrane protein YdiY
MVSIPVGDIERLSTEDAVHVLHGDDAEAVGRLTGVEDGKLVIESAAGVERIDAADIHLLLSAKDYESSSLSVLRSRYRFWKANFDLGFAATQATTDTSAFGLALGANRRKAPTRFTFGLGYRYGTQKEKGESSDKVEETIRGGLKGEYDLTPKWFLYAAGDATYDAIQHLSIRAVPQAGVGYRFYETKTGHFQVQAGGAWIYERYFGGDDQDFVSVAFGSELGQMLPYGAEFLWTNAYFPAVDDWANDYLFRTEAALIAPILDFVSAKASLLDEYDNTPSEGIDRNKLAVLVGLSLVF